MTGLTLSVALQLAVMASGAQTYEEARAKAAETGKPLVVLVGADWCPACQTMKQSTMAQLQRDGKLKDVEFAIVNTDRESSAANYLMRGNSIPQLVILRKVDDGWLRSGMVGASGSSTVESFIQGAVKRQAAFIASKSTKPRTTQTAGTGGE